MRLKVKGVKEISIISLRFILDVMNKYSFFRIYLECCDSILVFI